jgi:GNAT superfamily N-acetyltransferase
MSGASKFHCDYEDLSPGEARFGRIALLPWDADAFGFPVADCEIGDAQWVLGAMAEWQRILREWTARSGARLVSCSVGAGDRIASELLARCGFVFVDASLEAVLVRLQSRVIPPPRLTCRPAEAGDLEAVERIAAAAFQFGRYVTDPFFPAVLAEKRNVLWIRNAWAARGAEDQLFVLGEPGRVRGFFHVVQRGTEGDLRLVALDPAARGFGYDLFLHLLIEFKRQGVRRVTAKLSACNTAALNVYAATGFHFTHPRLTYHWRPAELAAGI